MIRKLILPAVAIALLGGCVSSGYGYRQDRGDYYYGQPRTEYRYYGSPYGYYDPAYRYGYPAYSRYPYGYGGYYGYPYGPYSRYPYYPYYPRPPLVVKPRPGDNNPPPPPPPPDDGDRNDRRPPWRNLDEIIRRQHGEPRLVEPAPIAERPRARAIVQPRDRDVGRSRAEPLIRRAQEEPREREIE